MYVRVAKMATRDCHGGHTHNHAAGGYLQHLSRPSTGHTQTRAALTAACVVAGAVLFFPSGTEKSPRTHVDEQGNMWVRLRIPDDQDTIPRKRKGPKILQAPNRPVSQLLFLRLR